MLTAISRRVVNFTRNPRMEGAVPGTPGTAPTNMSVTNSAGLTLSVVATGTENGIPYLELGVSGTSGAGGGAIIVSFETTTGIAAVFGQPWVSSFYFKLQSGSVAGFTNVLQAINELDSGGTSLVVHSAAAVPSGSALDSDRVQMTFTNNQATVAFVRGQLRMTAPALTAITCNLRIGGPQIEIGTVAGVLSLPPVGAPGVSQRWI